jgi:hypothetical protein
MGPGEGPWSDGFKPKLYHPMEGDKLVLNIFGGEGKLGDYILNPGKLNDNDNK